MPRRRRAALSAGLSAASDVFGTLLRQQLADQNARRTDALLRARTAEEKVTSGEWTVEQGEAFKAGQAVTPSVQSRLQSILTEGVTSATSQGGVEGPRALSARLRAARIPDTEFGVTSVTDPADAAQQGVLPSRQLGPTSSPEMQQALNVRREKLRAFPPTKIGSDVIGEGGSLQPVELFGRFDPDAQRFDLLDIVTSGGTAAQRGQAARAEFFENEGSPERAGREIDIDVERENRLRQPRARTAGAETAARTEADIAARFGRRGDLAAIAEAETAAREGAQIETRHARRDQIAETTAAETDARVVADINARHRKAAELSKIAFDETLARGQANLQLLGDEVRVREYAQQLQRVTQGSTDALRAIAQAEALLPQAEAELRTIAERVGLGIGEVGALAVDRVIPRQLLIGAPNGRRYLETLDTLRPGFARFAGDVGNLSLTEQERAGLVMPTVTDMVQGTTWQKLRRFQAFVAAGPQIFEALNGPSAPPLTDSDARVKIVTDILDQTEKLLAPEVMIGGRRARILGRDASGNPIVEYF